MEVRVTPGRCVTWRCYRVAHGPECEEHAAEPLPPLRRPRTRNYRRTAEQRRRNAEYNRRRRRESPGIWH